MCVVFACPWVCMEHYLGGLALSDGRLLHHLCIDRVLELAQPLLALHLGLQRLHFLSKKRTAHAGGQDSHVYSCLLRAMPVLIDLTQNVKWQLLE